MESLWSHLESVCGARLGRRFGLVAAGDRERSYAGRTAFVLRWAPDAPRLRMREISETPDGDETAAAEIARLIADVDKMEADEQPAVTRAILESRIVGLALEGRTGEDERPGPALLERLPFPMPDPVFARQLAILAGRSASDTGVDWAIERVVAELYALSLDQLVDVQTRLRAGG